MNGALAAGYSYRDVAGYFAVSKTTLHRHWQAHVAAGPVSAPVAPVRASGTASPAAPKWSWAAGIFVGFWLLMRDKFPRLLENPANALHYRDKLRLGLDSW
jgi:hypothetical protein